MYAKAVGARTILVTLGRCMAIEKIFFQNDFVWSRRENTLISTTICDKNPSCSTWLSFLMKCFIDGVWSILLANI